MTLFGRTAEQLEEWNQNPACHKCGRYALGFTGVCEACKRWPNSDSVPCFRCGDSVEKDNLTSSCCLNCLTVYFGGL